MKQVSLQYASGLKIRGSTIPEEEFPARDDAREEYWKSAGSRIRGESDSISDSAEQGDADRHSPANPQQARDHNHRPKPALFWMFPVLIFPYSRNGSVFWHNRISVGFRTCGKLASGNSSSLPYVAVPDHTDSLLEAFPQVPAESPPKSLKNRKA